MLELVEAIVSAWNRREKVFLATVVTVEGSAYRHEGAKLVVFEDGGYQGMISGGCLEPEISETVSCLNIVEPLYRNFDLRDDSVFGLGMGCGGMVGVLIEPALNRPDWNFWLQLLQRKDPSVRALVYQSNIQDIKAGAFLVIEHKQHTGSTGDNILDQKVLYESRMLLETNSVASKELVLPEIRLLLDVSLPPPHLVIFGAGDDAIPVAKLSRMAGFRVTVVDDRTGLASEERFPETRLYSLAPDQYSEIKLFPEDLIVIMHHRLDKDALALRQAIEKGCGYIGLLGPSHRFKKLQNLIKKQDKKLFSASDFSKIDTPIGVDISAQGADEIAFSIVAKLIAVRRGRMKIH